MVPEETEVKSYVLWYSAIYVMVDHCRDNAKLIQQTKSTHKAANDAVAGAEEAE